MQQRVGQAQGGREGHLQIMKLGKQPATYDSRDIRYSDVRPVGLAPALPPIPAPHGGYGEDFGADGWLMLGNGPCDDGSIPETDAAFQGAGDCGGFVVHRVAGLVFYSRNSGSVQTDALRGKSPGQVVLTHSGLAFQTGLPHSCANYVSACRLAGFFHGV